MTLIGQESGLQVQWVVKGQVTRTRQNWNLWGMCSPQVGLASEGRRDRGRDGCQGGELIGSQRDGVPVRRRGNTTAMLQQGSGLRGARNWSVAGGRGNQPQVSTAMATGTLTALGLKRMAGISVYGVFPVYEPRAGCVADSHSANGCQELAESTRNQILG